MAALRKDEEDAARHHEGKIEAKETRRIIIVHGSEEPAKRHKLA